MHEEKVKNLQEEPLRSIDPPFLFHPKYFKTCTFFYFGFLVGFLLGWLFVWVFLVFLGGFGFFCGIIVFDFLTFLSYFNCFYVFSKGLKDRL